jgi:hypothetical protein
MRLIQYRVSRQCHWILITRLLKQNRPVKTVTMKETNMAQTPSNHYLCGCRVDIYSKMKHPHKARRGDVRIVDFHVSNSPRNATTSCIPHDSATFQYTSFQNAGQLARKSQRLDGILDDGTDFSSVSPRI